MIEGEFRIEKREGKISGDVDFYIQRFISQKFLWKFVWEKGWIFVFEDNKLLKFKKLDQAQSFIKRETEPKEVTYYYE